MFIFCVDFIFSSDTDKRKDYTLCPVSHGRSPEPNTSLQKGINDSVL